MKEILSKDVHALSLALLAVSFVSLEDSSPGLAVGQIHSIERSYSNFIDTHVHSCSIAQTERDGFVVQWTVMVDGCSEHHREHLWVPHP